MKLVNLTTQPKEQNNHNPKITKQVLIPKGAVPHLTNLTQATFPPGELANEHTHQDMYEIFFIEKGSGTITINGTPHQVSAGSCMTVEPGDAHEVANTSDQDLLITYLGIEIA